MREMLSIKKIVFAFLLLTAQLLYADGINVETFHYGQSYSYMAVEDPLSPYSLIPQDYQYIFTGHYSYADDSLIRTNPEQTRRASVIVEEVQSFNLGLAFRLGPRWMLGASTFFSDVRADSISGSRLGDTRVFAKINLANIEKWKATIGMMPELIVPTGDSSLFISDDSVGGRLRFMGEKLFNWWGKKFMLAANVGYHHVARSRFENINYRNRVFSSVGMLMPLGEKWAMNLETQNSIVFPTDQLSGPGEYYAGLRRQLGQDWALQAGLSTGGFQRVRSVDYRLLAALKYAPKKKRQTLKPLEITGERLVFVVNFDFDKSNLDAQARAKLDEITDYVQLRKARIAHVSVEGHTDPRGTNTYNQKLSERRARSVKNYLNSKGILVSNRWVPRWYGEQQVKFFNGEGDFHRKNRRVEVYLKY